MNDDEILSRLLELVMEYADEPIDQWFDRVFSVRELAEDMGLSMAEVEQLAEARRIPGCRAPDGVWEFPISVILLFLAGPPQPEDRAWAKALLPPERRVARRLDVAAVAHWLGVPIPRVIALAEAGVLTGQREANGEWWFSPDDVITYSKSRSRERPR